MYSDSYDQTGDKGNTLVNSAQKFASELPSSELLPSRNPTYLALSCTPKQEIGTMGLLTRPQTTAPAPAAPPTDTPNAAADTTMPDAPAPNTKAPTPTQDAKKRKRKDKEPHILHQTTFRRPSWSYFHLSLITPGTAAQPSTSTASAETHNIDALTVSSLLLQPLTAYLGTTGAAVPVDIIHTQGRGAYVRIPRQDARGFHAALSGWVGGCDAGSVPGVDGGGKVRVAWRVVAEGGSLGLLGGAGEDVFGESGAAY